MMYLSNDKQSRRTFFLYETVFFFIKLGLKSIIIIIKFIFKYFWFILIIEKKSITDRLLKHNSLYENDNRFEKELKKIYKIEWNEPIQIKVEGGNIFFDISDSIYAYSSIFFSNKIMMFIVFITYWILKRKNPQLWINCNCLDKEYLIYQHLKINYKNHDFFKNQDEVNQVITLVATVINKVSKDKIIDKAGLRYFLWNEDYIKKKLTLFYIEQKIFFRPFDYSENIQKISVNVVKSIIESSRNQPDAEISKYVYYKVHSIF
jgi:hypothetical protein